MKQEILAGSVLAIIGLSLLIVSPSKLWMITEKWKTDEDGKPSLSYCILMRVLGIVFAGVGVALAVSRL